MPGELEFVATQDRAGAEMWDAVEQMRQQLNTSISTAQSAATSAAQAYTPARAGDWAGTPPSTIAEAQDRLAYHVSTGAGAVPIVALP